jgi:hypothetical protein
VIVSDAVNNREPIRLALTMGAKRVHNADELISVILAKRLVEHLERSGFVVMKGPPIEGGARAQTGTRRLTRAKILASGASAR